MKRWRLAFLLALQLVALSAWAAADSLTATQIKAAYLSKFAAYVEWPSSTFTADSPITIGVVGSEEIVHELHYIMKERTMNNRVVQVKSLKQNDSLADVQILFVGQKDGALLKHLLASTEVQPILTVTDSPGALSVGSIINFVAVDNHIRFEVSVAQAERNGLKISARLLSVAQKIEVGGQ